MEVCKESPKCTVLRIVTYVRRTLNGIAEVAILRPSTFILQQCRERKEEENATEMQDSGKCMPVFTDKRCTPTAAGYQKPEGSAQLVIKVEKGGEN